MRHPTVAGSATEKAAKQGAVFIAFFNATTLAVVTEQTLDAVENYLINDSFVLAFVNLLFVGDFADVCDICEQLV